jgi:hypothetical protein
MHLYPIDGAAARVPSNATAFTYRVGGWAGVDPDPSNNEAISPEQRSTGRHCTQRPPEVRT